MQQWCTRWMHCMDGLCSHGSLIRCQWLSSTWYQESLWRFSHTSAFSILHYTFSPKSFLNVFSGSFKRWTQHVFHQCHHHPAWSLSPFRPQSWHFPHDWQPHSCSSTYYWVVAIFTALFSPQHLIQCYFFLKFSWHLFLDTVTMPSLVMFCSIWMVPSLIDCIMGWRTWRTTWRHCLDWWMQIVVIESLVQSQSLTSRGLDQDQDQSTKAPIPQKTGLDWSKTAKNQSRPV